MASFAKIGVRLYLHVCRHVSLQGQFLQRTYVQQLDVRGQIIQD